MDDALGIAAAVTEILLGYTPGNTVPAEKIGVWMVQLEEFEPDDIREAHRIWQRGRLPGVRYPTIADIREAASLARDNRRRREQWQRAEKNPARMLPPRRIEPEPDSIEEDIRLMRIGIEWLGLEGRAARAAETEARRLESLLAQKTNRGR